MTGKEGKAEKRAERKQAVTGNGENEGFTFTDWLEGAVWVVMGIALVAGCVAKVNGRRSRRA